MFESDKSIREGNPCYGVRMQLYCRTGHHLAILPDGRVQGTKEDNNNCALLEFSPAGGVGLVQIRGIRADLYLAMGDEGYLYGEKDKSSVQTIFYETMLGLYNTYLSWKYCDFKWFVAIKKSGKPKPGPKTRWGQKAMQFLPRRQNDC